MDKIEQLYENYLTAQNNIAKFFGLEKMPDLCNLDFKSQGCKLF